MQTNLAIYRRAKKEVEKSYSVVEMISYIRRENPSNIVCHICLPDTSVMDTLSDRLERSEPHMIDKIDKKSSSNGSKKAVKSNEKPKRSKKQENRQFFVNKQYKIECRDTEDLADVINQIIRAKKVPQRIEFGERYHFLHKETHLNGDGRDVLDHRYRLLDTLGK